MLYCCLRKRGERAYRKQNRANYVSAVAKNTRAATIRHRISRPDNLFAQAIYADGEMESSFLDC